MPPTAAPDVAERAWHEFGDELRRYFARRVRDPVVAEDLRQETFVRLLGSVGKLDDGDEIAPWIFRIARSVLVDAHRRNRARRVRDATWTQEPEDPTEEFNGVVASWLRPMLESLPVHDREALELTEFGGLTQRALADHLGMGVSGAKSRVQRARARLRRAVEECCRVEVDRRGNVIDYAPRACCEPDALRPSTPDS